MLPAHTPTADMLTMTYGEPDDISEDSPSPRTKAGWAHAAVLAYMPLVLTSTDVRLYPPEIETNWSDTDFETLLVDLIADLMHLATFTGCDTEEVVTMARMHFEAEVGRGYEP